MASYAEVEKYNTFLTMHLQTLPPPGYGKISVGQILQADRQAWLRLAEKLAQGIRRRPDNSLPMDRALNELEADPRVTFYLLPLPAGESKRHQADPDPPIGPLKFLKGGKGKKGKGKEHVSVPKNSPEELMARRPSRRLEKESAGTTIFLRVARVVSRMGNRVIVDYIFVPSLVVDALTACRTTPRVALEFNRNSCKGPRRDCLGRVSLHFTS